MNATAIKLKIKLWHDDCPESPADLDGWKPYSFSRRHANFKHPDTFDEDEEIQTKLKAGLAFLLSYYEHGLCVWSLAGQGPTCRFDSVPRAGILVWEQDESDLGPKTYEERRTDAEAFIARFTEWCNGNVFGYTVEAFRYCHTCAQPEALSDEEAGLDLPSCGGYYEDDVDGMVTDIKDNIGDDWSNFEVTFEDEAGVYLADAVKRLWKGE